MTISWGALELWEVAAGWQGYVTGMSPSPHLAASLFLGPPCCEQRLPVPVWLELPQTAALYHLFPDMTDSKCLESSLGILVTMV